MNDTTHTPAQKLRSWADGLESAGQVARAKALRVVADDVESQIVDIERKLLEPIAELLAEMGRGGHETPGPAVEPEMFSIIAALKRQATLGPAISELMARDKAHRAALQELSLFYGDSPDHGDPNPVRLLELARRHASVLTDENEKLRDQVVGLTNERARFAATMDAVRDVIEQERIQRLVGQAVAEVGNNP